MIYKFSFFVPCTHSEQVKKAVFLTGAGRIGSYDCCAWETEGTGQFRPLSGSQPFIGKQGEIEKVKELKVELVCEAQYMEQALKAMKQAHPYEEPAYDVVKLEDF